MNLIGFYIFQPLRGIVSALFFQISTPNLDVNSSFSNKPVKMFSKIFSIRVFVLKGGVDVEVAI